MRGKIVKGIGGFYYVAAGGKIYSCKAKGIFRNENIKPLVGDEVEISVIDGSDDDIPYTGSEKVSDIKISDIKISDIKISDIEATITDIYERRNSLLRPAIANIDMVAVVQSFSKPAPQLYYLDRYLISVERSDIPIVIIFNKSDLKKDDAEKPYSEAGYKTFAVSAKTGEGMDDLKDFMTGKTIAFAGPSGVGKSTITNALCPGADMLTGGISRKIERGKHTTRHSELFSLGNNTFICDTPGFTSVTFEGIDSEHLRFHMPDIGSYEGRCRFNGCRHINEPDCAVKEAVKNGGLSMTRYDSYKKIYDEIYIQERRY